MANLTTRIGGQHYYKAATGNNESLLNFWRGNQQQYNALAVTGTTSGAPSGASSVTFTVSSSSIFTVNDIVFVTAGSGTNTNRTQGTVSSVPNGTSVIVDFTPAYSSSVTSGYQIDLYDPDTFYIITA